MYCCSSAGGLLYCVMCYKFAVFRMWGYELGGGVMSSSCCKIKWHSVKCDNEQHFASSNISAQQKKTTQMVVHHLQQQVLFYALT